MELSFNYHRLADYEQIKMFWIKLAWFQQYVLQSNSKYLMQSVYNVQSDEAEYQG